MLRFFVSKIKALQSLFHSSVGFVPRGNCQALQPAFCGLETLADAVGCFAHLFHRAGRMEMDSRIVGDLGPDSFLFGVVTGMTSGNLTKYLEDIGITFLNPMPVEHS